MQAEAIQPHKARSFIERCQKNPAFHIEQIQGVTTLEPYQKRICLAVAEYDRVAISACHDLGKTYIMARIVLALGSSFPGAKIITTAPTYLQVKQLLWSEIRAGHRTSKYPLGGEMLLTQWKIRDDWFALGFSPQKQAGSDETQGTASSFQGFHGGLVVVVFDEATGIPKQIWDQAEGMMTSGHVKFLAIGNPTSRNSEFFQCFKSPAWHKIYLSCFDSPNLIANGITDLSALIREVDCVRSLPEEGQQARFKSYKIVQPKLLSLSWVVAMAIKWGIEHPLFVSKVLGRFPEEDDHTLIPLGVVEQAQLREGSFTRDDPVSIGVDVARFGSDKSVITTLRAHAHSNTRVLVKRDTGEVTGEVIQEITGLLKEGCNPRKMVVVVDATGIGSGVVDQLIQAQREGVIPYDIEIRECHFGEGFEPESDDRRMYFNLKAKLFVQLASDLKSSLCLSPESVYLEELPTIIYRFDPKGRYMIESKDEYKKRTGRPSPDHADSLALSNYGRYASKGSGVFPEQEIIPSIASQEEAQW